MNQAQNGILLQLPEGSKRLYLLWGYLQHEILYLTWFLMEVALLTPFLATILPSVRFWSPGLFLLWLLLLMYLPFNLVRLMSTMDWPRSRQQFILATAVFLIYFLSIRNLFYQPASMLDFNWLCQYFGSIAETDTMDWFRNFGWFCLIVFVWWRGLRLIGKEFSISGVGRRLRVGGLVLAPFIIWADIGRLQWGEVPFILLFFMAGLTAIALTRVEEIEKQHSGRSAALNPKWLLSVFLAALLIILTTMLFTALISNEMMPVIFGWFNPLWQAFSAMGAVALNTVFNLLEPFVALLFRIFEWLIEFFTPMITNIIETLPTLPLSPLAPTPEPTETPQVDAGPATGIRVINILLMVALALAVSLALGRIYRKATFATQDTETAEAAATGTRSSRLNFGQRLLNRLGLLRDWRMAASIRRIYQNMCRAATVRGYPRAEAETPFEYLATLNAAWPEHQAETRLITEAYVKVRYGELPESPEELETIRQAWKQLAAVPPTDEKQTDKIKVEIDPLN